MRPRVAAVAGALLALVIVGCTAEPAPTPTPTASASRCPPTSLTGGPVTSQVVVVTASASSAAAGSVLSVRTEIVVLSDAPTVALRPSWSLLEVLDRRGVVARTIGSDGPDVPTRLTRGTTVAAPTVPTSILLTGCDGRPLAPGDYRLRAVVGYRSDATADAPTDGTSGYAMRSEPVDLTIT